MISIQRGYPKRTAPPAFFFFGAIACYFFTAGSTLASPDGAVRPGAILWAAKIDPGVHQGLAAVGIDDSVYFGSRHGRLYALNRDGSERWRFETKRDNSHGIAVDNQGFI